jgi:hypothetical protein
VKFSFQQISDAVRAALRGKLGESYGGPDGGWTIVATFEDAVIVQRGTSLTLEKYPITLDDGKAVLGEAETVAVSYGALKEAHGSLILGPILEEGANAKPGSKWAVVVIQEGMSDNRALYPADVLREAAPLYDGSKVFWNHSQGGSTVAPAMRDPRDIAGFLKQPKAALIEGAGKVGIVATLHATTATARERLLEAHEAGNPGLYGLSHTALGEYERIRHTDGKAALRVKKIHAVESVDIVAFPSAGGRIARLVAGLPSPVSSTPEELAMLEKKLARLKESRPDLFAKLSATPTEAEVDTLLLEAMTPAKAADPPKADPPKGDATGQTLSEADRSMLREARVSRLMEGRTLPEPIKATLREHMLTMASLGATEEQLKATVDKMVESTAKLVETTAGSGLGASPEVTKDEAEKLVEGLDGFFGQSLDDNGLKHLAALRGGKEIKRDSGFRSFKEAYIAITGDKGLTGRISEAVGLRRFQRLTEAISASTFAEILGDSIRRAMVADYRTVNYLDDWRKITSDVVPIADFRTNRRTRFGGYADLPAVAENGPYTALTSPTDEEATYAISKKGGKETISLETIANDDVGVIRRIPTSLARAAKRTLYKAVFDPLRLNSNIYTGTALALAGQNNISTVALSQAEVTLARQKMAEQAAFGIADEPLNLYPKMLLVPAELEELGWRLTTIPMQAVSAQNATEPSYNRARLGLDTLIVLPYWSDANNWWLVANPMDLPTIEVGFYQGRQEPELFLQDQPNVGALFSNDQLEYKIRYVFGVTVLDFRGFFGGIVP